MTHLTSTILITVTKTTQWSITKQREIKWNVEEEGIIIFHVYTYRSESIFEWVRVWTTSGTGKTYRQSVKKKSSTNNFLKSAPTDLITDSDWSIKTFFLSLSLPHSCLSSISLYDVKRGVRKREKKIKRSLVEIEMKFSNSNFNCTRFIRLRIPHFHLNDDCRSLA